MDEAFSGIHVYNLKENICKYRMHFADRAVQYQYRMRAGNAIHVLRTHSTVVMFCVVV
jgi:hypothetical protein